jgi:hypothetical protein
VELTPGIERSCSKRGLSMSRKRKPKPKYTAEFKGETVALCRYGGKSQGG